MRSSILAITGLCVIVLATPDHVAKRQDPSLSSVLARISSLSAELQPPSSIAAELTGIPASVTSILYNPSAVSSLQADIIANGLPAWYTSLPADAQSYVLGLGTKVASIVPEIISLEVAAGLTTLPGAAGTGVGTGGTASATGTRSGNGTVTTATLTASSSGKATGVSTTTEKAGSSSAKASSTSSAGAAQTNAVVAGVVGAIGFLGMALAL